MAFRITYSVLNADLSDLHKEFDVTLEKAKKNLGQEFGSYILNQKFLGKDWLEDRNPADTRQVLGKFSVVPEAKVDAVLQHAKAAQRKWGRTDWQERARIL